MQKHVKVYYEYFWYEYTELFKCECCDNTAIEIHHILYRSSFGKKTKHLQDIISNLIALCRDCHDRGHFKKEPYLQKDELQEVHNNNL